MKLIPQREDHICMEQGWSLVRFGQSHYAYLTVDSQHAVWEGNLDIPDCNPDHIETKTTEFLHLKIIEWRVHRSTMSTPWYVCCTGTIIEIKTDMVLILPVLWETAISRGHSFLEFLPHRFALWLADIKSHCQCLMIDNGSISKQMHILLTVCSGDESLHLCY